MLKSALLSSARDSSSPIAPSDEFTSVESRAPLFSRAESSERATAPVYCILSSLRLPAAAAAVVEAAAAVVVVVVAGPNPLPLPPAPARRMQQQAAGGRSSSRRLCW